MNYSDATVSGSTFSNNTATSFGGAIYNAGGSTAAQLDRRLQHVFGYGQWQ